MTNEQRLDRITSLLEAQVKTMGLIAELLAERKQQFQSGPQKSGEWKGQNRDEPLDTSTPRGTWCEFVMPFGKHKGKRLDECPASYLAYFAGQLAEGAMKEGGVKEAISEYVAASKKSGNAPPPETPAKASSAPAKPQSSGRIDDDVPF